MEQFKLVLFSWVPIICAMGHLSCIQMHEKPCLHTDANPLHLSVNVELLTDRIHGWNNVRYILPPLPGYRFFDESVLGYQTIKEFTLTDSQPLAVEDFELLVPDSVGKDPLIHIYTFDITRDVTISNSDFSEYKKEWILNLGNGTFNDLTELLWNSKEFKKRFPDINPSEFRQKNYAVLQNDKIRLSYLMCIEDKHLNQVITYTNHLHINGTVVFIKAWLTKRATVDDVMRSLDITNRYIDAFLNKNITPPEY
jgi:hypothetical protein